MKIKFIALFVLFMLIEHVSAQTISREDLIFLTSEWKGERFADGRPKVPDELIKRARNIGIEEAWQVLRNEGYNNQFEGNWKMVHDDVAIVGRAFTASYMPSRPDIEKNIKERGLKAGRVGNTNSWPIEQLSPGDVYVADGFGKIAGGTLIGDNLGNAIFNKSGNGVIFDGSARDLCGLTEIKGFNAFVRDFDPSYMEGMVLMGMNTPIRIGHAIVLPGDVVISEKEGVLFIPAQLAELVVATAEFIWVKDKFGHAMLKANRYTTGQIDSQWNDQIKNDFLQWLDQNPSEPRISRKQLDEFMKKRTW